MSLEEKIDETFTISNSTHSVTLHYDGHVTEETIKGTDRYLMKREYKCPLLEPKQVYEHVKKNWKNIYLK